MNGGSGSYLLPAREDLAGIVGERGCTTSGLYVSAGQQAIDVQLRDIPDTVCMSAKLVLSASKKGAIYRPDVSQPRLAKICSLVDVGTRLQVLPKGRRYIIMPDLQQQEVCVYRAVHKHRRRS